MFHQVDQTARPCETRGIVAAEVARMGIAVKASLGMAVEAETLDIVVVEQVDTAGAEASLGMAAGVGAEQHTVVMKLVADKAKKWAEVALLPALPREFETKM